MAKSRLSNKNIVGVFLMCAASLGGAQALNKPATKGDGLAVEQAWQPHMPAVVGSRAGYLTLHNFSADNVVIVGVSSPNFETVAMHRSVLKHSSVTMEPLSILDIAAGETVRFAPHGLHLMLHKPIFDLQVGENFPVVLRMDDGGEHTFLMQVVERECEQCAAEQKEKNHHHGH